MSMRAEAHTAKFLSMAETCRRLRLSRWTVRKLVREGEIKAVKGPARNAHIRVYEQSVEDYLTRYTISPPAPRVEGAA